MEQTHGSDWAGANGLRPMEGMRRVVPQLLAVVRGYIWNGETPPVPAEDTAYAGLLLRAVEDLPGAPRVAEPAEGQIRTTESEAIER